MPSLLLTIFLLQVASYLVDQVGINTIVELLWSLYIRFPTPISSLLQKQTLSRNEVVRLKREMTATSAQDNFAKWARLRREHDKAQDGYDEIATQTSSHKTRFTTVATWFWYVSVKGLRFALQFWYSRTPVFYLPPGWAPGIVGWVVGFPRARSEKTNLGLEAKGKGVSVLVWALVCGVVIGIVGDVVKESLRGQKAEIQEGNGPPAQAQRAGGESKGARVGAGTW